MPYKSTLPPITYLDPELVPSHPANFMPDFSVIEGYWGPDQQRPKQETKRLQKEWLTQAMEDWTPPHVPRSWETDETRSTLRTGILNLLLSPRIQPHLEFHPDGNKTDKDEDKTDFRKFANQTLHLSYHRFHASHGEPHIPSEETDPNIPPEDICWIMEYTENECAIIRRQIARMMGLYPAVFDDTNPDYDEEYFWRYERRLYIKCRRLHKKCVRPSHLTLYGPNGQLIP